MHVLSLPPCPGSVSEQAPADVPANSMWDGLSCGVEVCAQRSSSKELHVRGPGRVAGRAGARVGGREGARNGGGKGPGRMLRPC